MSQTILFVSKLIDSRGSPWHGGLSSLQMKYMFAHSSIKSACFNVCTGDIGTCRVFPPINYIFDWFSKEDAPAPSAIHSFKAHVSGGKIHVTADPARTIKGNMARAPKLSSTTERSGSKSGVLIVGGGSGTFHAVESLRENGYTGVITIISKENYPPIDRSIIAGLISTNWSFD
jgi:apoptosis-inducing factor 3